MGESLVQVRGLVKTYGALHAVDGIDLTLHQGEIFAFLGPNGAGKTTTVEILEGIRPRTAGDVRVLGKDPWTDRKTLQRQVGVIPQDFSFFDKITPVEGLEFYASLFDKKIDPMELLAKVELTEKANDQFDKLSGGQKQKMGLALALVNDPEVLFLDEPTTGLDPQARRAVWGVLRGLRTDGRAIFLTTHYLEEAQTLADHVAIIQHGKITAQGTPDDLILRFGRPEGLRIGAPPSVAEYLRSRWPKRVEHAEGHVLVETGGKDGVVEVLTMVRASGLPWTSVETVNDSLEDVFVRLVGRMDEGKVVGADAAAAASTAPKEAP